MSASLISTSSQRLVNSAVPVVGTGYPLTVGFWYYPTSVSAAIHSMWSFGSSTDYFNLYLSTSTPRITVNVGAGNSFAALGTNVAANSWYYIVGRFINATNQRIAQLYPSGSTAHAQQVTSRAPTGMTTMALGSREIATPAGFFDGLIAEMWYTDTDIQADGGQLDDSLLRQLAYGGPFSVPHVAANLVEYRALRSGLSSDQDRGDEVFSGGARQTWTNTGAATLGAHPPLPYWYRSPSDVIRNLII